MSRWLQLRSVALVAVLAGTLGACAVFGGSSEDEHIAITADFERTFNLFQGSRVRVVGVDSGKITKVDVERGSDRVRVEIELHKDVEVPADAGAVIVQSALLGERYVQLAPAYEGGPKMEDGAHIPLERTSVPVEFEEAFDSLESFLEGLDRDEVARLVTNLADVLDGQGESLGETIDSVRDVIVALRQSDEDLVRLARTLSDLNATVATRADAMAQQFVDLNTVAEALSSERADLDRALNSLLRMVRTVGDTVATHRGNLTEDISTITRLGRTIDRNHEHYADFIKGQAELFRHTSRGLHAQERNWTYVRNHYDAVPELIADRLSQRLVGLCLRLEIEDCAEESFWTQRMPTRMCMPPVVPCPTEEEGDEDVRSVTESLHEALQDVPELVERLSDDREELLDDELGTGQLDAEVIGALSPEYVGPGGAR